MAEEDQSSKTEEATPKKLDDAFQRGEVAKSQEISHWFMLFGGTMALALFAEASGAQLSGFFTGYFERVGTMPADGGRMVDLMGRVGMLLIAVLALPFMVLVLAAIGGNLIQHRPVLSAERLKPKFSKISPLGGLKRLFSLRSFTEFLKGLLKITIVGAIAVLVLMPELDRLDEVVRMPLEELLLMARALALRMLVGALAAMAVIAVIDFVYQRFEFAKQQRMSRQEIKDEYKQTEGDPMIKARLRQIRMERSRRRMMAAVPQASVVITNPTHFAVALKYDGEMSAPRLVAKGADLVALRIRELASEHGVPIVENPPLARALHAALDIDDEIHPDHYKAVAEVIGFVMRRDRRAAGGLRPPSAGRQGGNEGRDRA